jgi:hypothetical protein
MLPTESASQTIETPVNNEPVNQVPASSNKRFLIISCLIILFVIAGIAFAATKLGNTAKKVPQQLANQSIISGNLDLNGFFPKNSTITLAVRKPGERQFNEVLTNISPIDLGKWSWYQAEKGQKYEIQAYLQIGAKTVEKSDLVTVSAPFSNAVLRINSNQPTVADKSEISGTFSVTGFIPKDALVTIETVTKGEFPKDHADFLAKAQGAWVLGYPVKGKSYSVVGYLKLNDKIIGQSTEELTVTAPARHEILIIKSSLGNEQSPAVSASGSSEKASEK